MYKIFINDKPFILTKEPVTDAMYLNLPRFTYESENLMAHVRSAEEMSSNGLQLICSDLDKAWKEFNLHFKSIEAAGGLVFNPENHLLIIKRLGKWDLPKGKIDPGEKTEEAAIREVEEECGISKLHIVEKLTVSYHSYKLHGHRFLKVTHWFLMNSIFKGRLVPQEEENITEATWVDLSLINVAEMDTYNSIKDILLLLKSPL
jgi:8-oxo-dGTP pyrophosphatase MutT (NUDIX family)